MYVVPAFMPTVALAGGLCLAGTSVLCVSVEAWRWRVQAGDIWGSSLPPVSNPSLFYIRRWNSGWGCWVSPANVPYFCP